MESKNKALPGGSMNQVERIGDTVHRQVKGSPTLHSYLLYLEKAGMNGVPRFLGLDEQGREILTYMPGKTQGNGLPFGHPCLMSEETIVGAASFLRKLHDVSVGFLSEALEKSWVNTDYPHKDCDTICHNDAAVWNFVFIDENVAGLIDFDAACAGERVWDLAWSVYGTVHLLPWVLGEDYMSSKHSALYKRRVKLYFDAYGMECPPDFMEMVYRRIKIGVCDDLIKGVVNGDETSIRLVRDGALAHYKKVAAFIKECGHDWV